MNANKLLAADTALRHELSVTEDVLRTARHDRDYYIAKHDQLWNDLDAVAMQLEIRGYHWHDTHWTAPEESDPS
jgi:hypothetical protein